MFSPPAPPQLALDLGWVTPCPGLNGTILDMGTSESLDNDVVPKGTFSSVILTHYGPHLTVGPFSSSPSLPLPHIKGEDHRDCIQPFRKKSQKIKKNVPHVREKSN